jgi:hypothetical protein
MDSQCLDLDLHRLELRFAGARLVEPRAVERIARSIECGGQIVPCIAVAAPAAEAGGERADPDRWLSACRGVAPARPR